MRISRKSALTTLTSALVSLPFLGMTRSKKELQGFKQEFGTAWKRSQEYTLTVFNQMPEEHLDFQYTPESFSFRTQFVHCIVFTALQLAGRLEIANPYEN